MSPFDVIPGGPIAGVDLGSGANDPQLHIDAPDGSCIWEGFPVELRACYFRGITPSDPPTTYQTTGYPTPFGPGPFTPPEATWPVVWAYNTPLSVLSGYKMEARVTGRTTYGSTQVGVANASTGGANDPSGTYYIGSFDTGWFDANSPDCAQAANTPGAGGALAYGVTFRPFSPIAGAGIVDGSLSMRWVPSGVGSPTYGPFQTLAIVYGPPQPAYLQETLYRQNLDGLAGSTGTSPPSGNWTNGIIVGDAGITAGGSSTSGHGSGWWSAQAFASTCKVSIWPRVMPTGSDAIWLYARLADAGTSSVTGYALKVEPPSTFRLYRIDAGSLTLLDSFAILRTFDVGDGFELQCNGSTITARYHDRDVVVPCYVDAFHDVLAVTDATYRSVESAANVGYAGLGIDGTTQRVYGFGAGSYFDPMPGLYVYLETNSCGVLTKTYTQLATAIDAAGQGFDASTLGGHGADVADVDNDLFLGADCSGGVRRKAAVPR